MSHPSPTDSPSSLNSQDESCLRAVDLTMSYGAVTTLSALNLSVAKGEILSVLGPNGAGKTTTINLFMGFTRPTSGRAEVCGICVDENPLEARRRIAYIPESVSLYGNLTGTENLEYFASLGGVKGLNKSSLHALLARAGLQQSAFDRRCSTYSKGMRQKVCVALALAKNAQAMLLDEPTSGLDPYAAAEFSTLVSDLARQGVGALVATHDLLLAKQMSDRVLILVGGRVRQIFHTKDLTVGELEERYLNELATAEPSARGPE